MPVLTIGKLGKLAPYHEVRDLKLVNYIRTGELPLAPDELDYSMGVEEWPMYLNNKIGCCTCAAMAHMIQSWTQFSRGDDVKITDADVQRAYMDVSGYDPNLTDGSGNNPTDNGANEHEVMNYCFKTGIGGHKIGAWVDVDPKNLAHVKLANYWFGGLYIGVNLPKSIANQDVWDTVGCWRPEGRPGSLGGHAVDSVKYDRRLIWVPTWGKLQAMTWKFWLRYVDEAHAILSEDWFDPISRKSPVGLDLETLSADLRLVTA